MDEQTPTAADAFFALAYAHDKLAALMNRCTLGAADKTAVLRSALHASQIELVGGMACLYRGQRFASIPILLRSLLEATADLLALLKDARKSDEFDRRYYVESINMMREFLALPDPPEGMSNAFREMLSVMEPALEQLKKAGVPVLKTRARFEAGDLGDHYGVYVEVCMDAHNNAGALMRRHVISGEPDGALEFVLYREYDGRAFVRQLALAADLLVLGAETFHRAQETGFLPDVLKVREDCGRWMCGLRPEGVKR